MSIISTLSYIQRIYGIIIFFLYGHQLPHIANKQVRMYNLFGIDNSTYTTFTIIDINRLNIILVRFTLCACVLNHSN